MTKEQAPDCTGLPITKLPPGEAFGARDLQRWSQNAAAGRAGSFNWKECKKQRKLAKRLSKKAGRRIKPFK
jgi:hypothetical protein